MKTFSNPPSLRLGTLAILLTARFGNHGLWAALLSFMALRAITLSLRLKNVEAKAFPALAVEVS